MTIQEKKIEVKKKIGGNQAFFLERIKLQLKKNPYINLYFKAFFKNARLPPIFFLNKKIRTLLRFAFPAQSQTAKRIHLY